MPDYELDEVRRIRRQIAAQHGHDVERLVRYYRQLEQEVRASGNYLFADAPQDEAERTEPTPT